MIRYNFNFGMVIMESCYNHYNKSMALKIDILTIIEMNGCHKAYIISCYSPEEVYCKTRYSMNIKTLLRLC